MGDPAFASPEAPTPEAPSSDHGVVLAWVQPGSNAAQDGLRSDGKPPMPKAEALRGAKRWLQTLPPAEAEQLAAGLLKAERSGQHPLKVLTP